MSAPYYQDEWVTLYHGDCLDVMRALPDASVGAVLTDPPYNARTHAKSRTNTPQGEFASGIDFTAMSPKTLRFALAECGRVSRGWVVATLAYQHAVELEASPPDGLRVLRIGVWVKPDPMPQITGDRPAQGWEAIAYMHRSDVRSKWSGGGKHGNYILSSGRNEGHPTTKPIGMLRDMVRRFTEPGETVLDPFAGSGTTLRAAVDEGRRAIGVEIDAKYCAIAASRMPQGALDFGALA